MKHLWMGAMSIAAAAAPLLAQAENKLYGQFNVSANHVEAISSGGCTNQTAPGNFAPLCAQDGQSGDNNGSRIGFQGEKGQFFYALELGLGADDDTGLGTTRHAFVGFNSSVGTFSFGRTNTPYKLSAQRVDPFYDTSAANYLGGFSPEGTSYGASALANGWTNNSISWLSPNRSGLTVNAGIYLQEFNNEDHDFNVGAEYATEEFVLGAQYVAVGANEFDSPEAIAGSAMVDSALQLTASTMIAGLGIGISFEQVDLRSGADRQYVKASVTYQASDAVRYAASIGQVDQGTAEGIGFTVGAFVKLIEQFELFALFSKIEFENDDTDQNETAGVGVKYAFEI